MSNVTYEHIKNCLRDQRETARNYTNRGLAIFVVGTTIIGIGLPLVLNAMQIANTRPNALISTFFALAIFSYVVLARFAYLVTKPKRIETLDNPTGFEDELFAADEYTFIQSMLKPMRESFKRNEDTIDFKEQALKALVPVLMLETLVTVGAVVSAVLWVLP